MGSGFFIAGTGFLYFRSSGKNCLLFDSPVCFLLTDDAPEHANSACSGFCLLVLHWFHSFIHVLSIISTHWYPLSTDTVCCLGFVYGLSILSVLLFVRPRHAFVFDFHVFAHR